MQKQKDCARIGEWNEGEFTDGLIENNNLSYYGQFKDGLKNGRGVDTFQDRVYFGEFLDGKKEGHGVWISKNAAFVGTFRQNHKTEDGFKLEIKT